MNYLKGLQIRLYKFVLAYLMVWFRKWTSNSAEFELAEDLIKFRFDRSTEKLLFNKMLIFTSSLGKDVVRGMPEPKEKPVETPKENYKIGNSFGIGTGYVSGTYRDQWSGMKNNFDLSDEKNYLVSDKENNLYNHPVYKSRKDFEDKVQKEINKQAEQGNYDFKDFEKMKKNGALKTVTIPVKTEDPAIKTKLDYDDEITGDIKVEELKEVKNEV